MIAARFTIERRVAKGGMGEVYRARDLHTGEPVAIKVLDRNEGNALARFNQEAALLSKIHHPNIVRYVAHGRLDTKAAYLVMEWLAGEDLQTFLRRRQLGHAPLIAPSPPTSTTHNEGGERKTPPLPEIDGEDGSLPNESMPREPVANESVIEETISLRGTRLARPMFDPLPVDQTLILGRSLASAVTELHRRGVIHRDIKPGNVFVSGGALDRIKLIDLGVARQENMVKRLTRTGHLLGTPQYMAPEQASARGEITPATDVWAIGCVLYQCLTGVKLFSGYNIAAILASILFDDPVPVKELRRDVPDELADLVMRMLRKEPSERPSDANEVAQALDAVAARIAGSPSQAIYGHAAPHLTTAESRMTCRIFLDVGAASADGETLPEINDLRDNIGGFGAILAQLADGSVVATFAHDKQQAATDRAAQAGYAALYLKARFPRARVVMVMGRGKLHLDAPLGDAFDKTVTLLQRHASTESYVAEHPDAVWIDAASAGLIGARFHIEQMAPTVYAMWRERGDVAEPRPLLGKVTPCVGRDHELSMLESTFAFVAEEHMARALLITAPPGMGKSRLRHEFLRRLSAREEDVTVIFGHGDPVGISPNQAGLLGRALRRLCGITANDSVEAGMKRLEDRVGRHMASAEVLRVAALLGELCGVIFPDHTDERLRQVRDDQKLLHEAITHAWLEFLRIECDERPVALVLDDLQWSDPLTVSLVDRALRDLDERPLFVLALGRPDVKDLFPNLWSGKAQEMPLAGLNRRASERLARRVLGAGVPEAMIHRVAEQAGGNPYYLEELIRAVALSDKSTVPETILAMLGARLFRLDPGARQVLRAASVFGRSFWRGGVLTLLGGSEHQTMVDGWLDYLVATDIVQRRPESQFPGDEEYCFRQDMMREAAYSGLTPQDRELGHRLAAGYLFRVGEQDPLVLAQHLEHGDEPASAAPYLAQAAARAWQAQDIGAVLRLVDRGLACGAHGTDVGVLRTIQALALLWTARLERAYAVAIDAMSFVPAGSAYWYRALGCAFASSGFGGQIDALSSLIQAYNTAEPEAGARSACIEATALLASTASLAGRQHQVYVLLDRVETMVGTSQDALLRGFQAHGRHWYTRAFETDLWRALETAEAAAAAFAEVGDHRMHALWRVWAAVAWWRLSDRDRAMVELRAGADMASHLQASLVLELARAHLALILAERGAPADLDEAHQLASVLAVSDTYAAGLAHCALAVEMAARGQSEAARRHGHSAIGVLASMPPVQLLAYDTLGRILLVQGRVEEARELIADGIAILGALGGEAPDGLRLHLLMAECRYALDEPQAAATALREVRAGLTRQANVIADAKARARYLAESPEARRIAALSLSWKVDLG